MTRTIDIPLSPDTRHVTLAHVCVRCGAPSDAVITIKVRNEKPAREVTLDVAYCAACKPITDRLAGAAWIIAFIAGAIAAVGVFLGLSVMMDQVELFLGEFMPSTESAAVGVIGMTSLLIGAVIGILFETLSRVILLPFGGDPLTDPPPIAVDLFQPGVSLRGLRASLNTEGSVLHLRYTHDKAAQSADQIVQKQAASPRKGRRKVG